MWRTNVTKTRPCPRHWRPKPRMTFLQLLLEAVGLARAAAVARRLHCCGMRAIERQGFFCALYSVVASVTRWLPCSHGKVSMTRWAGLTRPCFHGGRGLDGDEFIHECLVDAAPKLAEGLGEYKMRLRARGLVLPQATGVHHGKVRAQAVADILIRPAQFVFE